MSRLPISIACWNYDRTRAIADGSVPVEGCDVTYLPLGPEEVFFRAFRHHEFDVTELSLSTYMMATARERAGGEPLPYKAIPVFVSRAFRHSGIYIRTDRGIERPEDLKGRVVGVPEYQVTAAVWIRGILQHEYGVAPADISWRSGGVEDPGRHEKFDLTLPDGVELKAIPADDTLGRMLEEGEIDALVAPRAPSCYDRGAPNVGRLWPNVREVERAYFAKTRIFPIMHVVGVRRSLIEANPWLASSVYKAFIQAKRAAQPELTQVAALKIMLPWVAQEAEETIALMGQDFWPYGIDDNGPTLDAILQYHFEQGLSGDRPLTREDLFLPGTMERVKV